eukprot:Colp12_sorted_trinity150504_noHs@26046
MDQLKRILGPVTCRTPGAPAPTGSFSFVIPTYSGGVFESASYSAAGYNWSIKILPKNALKGVYLQLQGPVKAHLIVHFTITLFKDEHVLAENQAQYGFAKNDAGRSCWGFDNFVVGSYIDQVANLRFKVQVNVLEEIGQKNDQRPSTGQSTALAKFGELLKTGRGADVTLVASFEGHRKEFKVHRFILELHSNVLKQLLGSGMREAVEKRLEFSVWEIEIIESVLQFMYTGMCDLEKNTGRLLQAAQFFEIDPLRNLCKYRLMDDLNANNLAEIAELVSDHAKLCICLTFTHTPTKGCHPPSRRTTFTVHSDAQDTTCRRFP